MAKSAKQIEREIADVVGLRDGWTKVRVRKDWPETWEKYIRAWWYTVEKQKNGRWALGWSHRRGDVDSIMRGSTYASWEAAAKFAEEHAGAFP